MTVVPVVIAGAGPTGVTAALLLARYGVPSLVLDRWDGVYPQPRAVHLDDEVCRILSRIGVAGEFARISRPGLGLRLVDRELRVLAQFGRSSERGQHGFPQANMFDQPDLERLLRTAVSAEPLVTLRGNSVVTAARPQGDHVAVEFVDRITGATQIQHARYVLGCDGANSAVRAEIGSRMRNLGFEQRWLVVDVETSLELGHWEGVHQVCDPLRAATYMRIGDTRYRWEFQLLAGERAAEYSSLAAVRRLIGPWLPDQAGDEIRLIRCAEYTFRAQVADRWRDRRILLLGDAAHLTPPFIGQGLGAGLRDGANLSWKLAGVLQGTLDDAALDTYETERKAHATAMIRLAVLMGRLMTGGGRAGSRARRAIAPRLHLVPGVRARVSDSTTPGLRRSALVRRPVRPRSLGGALCPNAELDDGTRLDDVRAAFLVLVLVRNDRAARHQAPAAAARAGHGTVIRVRPRSVLGRWLRRHGARVAVIRPDGTVLSAGRRTRTVLATLPGFPRLASSLDLPELT